ncbi:hypothetical protein BURKHO8Y_150102 [Burkholderia sp. 8Y]|nr:hypothetical protein BURKHO8Y_150102 [Burkholderia sp. 8Y]
MAIARHGGCGGVPAGSTDLALSRAVSHSTTREKNNGTVIDWSFWRAVRSRQRARLEMDAVAGRERAAHRERREPLVGRTLAQGRKVRRRRHAGRLAFPEKLTAHFARCRAAGRIAWLCRHSSVSKR